MKKKEVKKKRSTPKTMKQKTKEHEKFIGGRKENPNHLEDFEKVLKEIIK